MQFALKTTTTSSSLSTTNKQKHLKNSTLPNNTNRLNRSILPIVDRFRCKSFENRDWHTPIAEKTTKRI
jgi:hypothetical protein